MRTIALACSILFLITIVGPAQTPQPIEQTTRVVPAEPKPRLLSKLPEQAQPVYISALRATEWLKQASMKDGRFVYGFEPALRVQLDGDNFRSQAGATFALARASRYFRDGAAGAKASQAALSLLLETMPDAEDATARHTAATPKLVHRLSSLGLFVSAIHEMPTPPADLVKAADEMCNYLRKAQNSDGSLGSPHDAEHAGWALQGIIRSQKHRPAAWKLDLLKKARVHYFAAWQTNKSIDIVCSHTPAYAEAFAQTKEREYADAVFAMNDWLLGLQYRDEIEMPRKAWNGAFQRFREGRAESVPPDVRDALGAESLADACRVARLAGDLGRLKTYEKALIASLHYTMSLQYTPNRVDHFSEKFRPWIVGAFHASPQDGNLRLDYTQHPLCAMVQYLDLVVE